VASASLGLGLDLLVATMSLRLSSPCGRPSTDLTDRYDISDATISDDTISDDTRFASTGGDVAESLAHAAPL
jgi:hypothetical protein